MAGSCPHPVLGNPVRTVAVPFALGLGKTVRAGGGRGAATCTGDDPDGRQQMTSEDAALLRAMVARCNLLCSDRPDLHGDMAMAATPPRKRPDPWRRPAWAMYLTCERRRLVQLVPC